MTVTVPAPEIRDAVREMFNRVATAPADRYRFEVGAALALAVGYPPDILATLPPAAGDRFTGLAYLHPHLELSAGERLLDLGCGAGLDAVLAGRAVGPGGHVVGLDVSDAMVAAARRLGTAARARHVRFERGEAESMEFAAASFDAALVNGLLNLCPDKAAVVRELGRVLRPGGRAIVAEITFARPLPTRDVQTADDWFR